MKRIVIAFSLSIGLVGCGSDELSEVKIVSGSSVANGDPVAGSTVALLQNGQGFCTATIIGPNQLSSAAHCFQQGPPSQIGSGPRGQPIQGLSGFQFKNHPKYDGNSGYYDIAVVTFSGTLPADMKPVKVADPGVVQSGAATIVAGYGVTSDRAQDGGTLRKVSTTVGQVTQNKEFTSTADGKGPCYGDSGGPTYVQRSSGMEVIGATSRAGQSQQCTGGDAIYTNLTVYQGWMKCAFQSLGKPLEYLKDDDSASDCNARPAPGGGGGGYPPGGPGGPGGGYPPGGPGGPGGGYPPGGPGGPGGGYPPGGPGGPGGGFPPGDFPGGGYPPGGPGGPGGGYPPGDFPGGGFPPGGPGGYPGDGGGFPGDGMPGGGFPGGGFPDDGGWF